MNNAEDALTSFEPRYTTDDPDHTDHYGFTFLQEDAKEDISSHGYNILMLDAYDRALTQTILDKQIKTGLEAMQNKLDMINYLIGTDVGRAKLTLQEILHPELKVEPKPDADGIIREPGKAPVLPFQKIESVYDSDAYPEEVRHDYVALEHVTTRFRTEFDLSLIHI